MAIPPTEGITGRAFALGAAASLAIGAGIGYANSAIRGSRMADDFSSPIAFIILFLIVAVLNPLLRVVRRSWPLNAAETTLIYVMALISASICSMGLMDFFLPFVSGAQYYARPENRWAEIFLLHVPDWLAVKDAEAVTNFYEGNPRKGAGIPWEAWMPPLLGWLPFLLSLYLVMVATMVILRRQWMDHERLLYPLMQPSMALMVRAPGRLLPALMSSGLFWLGASIPFAVGVVNALHAYDPDVPKIELQSRVPLFDGAAYLTPSISFAAIGFTYFLSQDIALGIWLFNLLAKFQEAGLNILGIPRGATMDWVTVPILAHQNIGALIVFVLFGLWLGRAHLRSVYRKAFIADAAVDDSEEIMSYRTSVLVILGGIGVMWFWLCQSGLSAWAAGVSLFIVFVIFIGLTRMVTEGGFFNTRAPINPGNFMVTGFGVNALGGTGVTALGYSFVWAGELRLFVMAATANGLKLVENIRADRRMLPWAIVVAILLSAAGSVWIGLTLGYGHGAINMHPNYTGMVRYPFDFISRNILNTPSVDWTGWILRAWGGTLMTLLMLARQRLRWWPIHPLGLPISAMWMTDRLLMSVFTAWLIKGVMLRYGGLTLYQKFKPLFIGLVAGQFFSMAFWLVVDFFTGMTGNMVYLME